MAVLALTAAPDVLRGLPAAVDFPLSIVASTARDNGDGGWTVAAHTEEANIPALEAAGVTVRTVVTDADQLARWETLDTQIDDDPGVA